MLIGSFTHTVDAKGRVFIPAKWRDDLGGTIIFTRGFRGQDESKCLIGMPIEYWKDFAKRFSSLPLSDNRVQNMRRMIFANANDSELDKQGRALMDSELRKYAGIDRDVVLVGIDRYMEIWGLDAWTDYCRECDEGLTDMGMDILAQMGI